MKLTFALLGFSVFFFLFLFLKPFTIVGAGDRGVVMKLGRVQDTILSEGLHFYTPIVTSVKKITVRTQKSDVKATAASRDLQDVTLDVVVNWAIDPSKVNSVFQQIGDEKDVYEKIIGPAVNEMVKASTAKKTAEEIITKRPELKADIDLLLKERLAQNGILLGDVSLVDVKFSPEFNAAIEAKQVAEQEAQKAVFVAQKAQNDATARINQARGEAEAQRLQQQTLTPELLQKMAIEKWDRKFPQYMGAQTLPFIALPR